MENCLIKTLKGKVNGELPYYGGLFITTNPDSDNKHITINSGSPINLRIVNVLEGDCYLGTSGVTELLDWRGGQLVVGTGSCVINVSSKYDLTMLSSSNQNRFGVNLDDLQYSYNISALRVGDAPFNESQMVGYDYKVKGSIESLGHLLNLETLTITSRKLYVGDLFELVKKQFANGRIEGTITLLQPNNMSAKTPIYKFNGTEYYSNLPTTVSWDSSKLVTLSNVAGGGETTLTANIP